MGILWSKIFCRDLNSQLNIENNSEDKNDEIESEGKNIESELHKLNEDKITREYIENFVEEWYNNNPDVDLGTFKLAGAEVDLIPDFIEKKIYKKTLLISFTLLKKICEDTTINLLDHEIKLSIKPKKIDNNN